MALVLAFFWRRERSEHLGGSTPRPLAHDLPPEPDNPVHESAPPPVQTPPPSTNAAADAATPTPRAPRVFAHLRWGSGPDQLGHDRPSEGAPEAPMSLAQDTAGRVLVLDQINRRIVRFDANGHPIGTVPINVRAAQDLAVGRDGSIAVLDRLGDGTVALIGPDGSERGQLPLVGHGITEGGGTTGVFVDGDDVYVEREHGPLVRLGDTQGTADPTRPEIQGRPTRDGSAFISAGLIDAASGRYYVNSIARDTNQHRFTRAIQSQLSLHGILLLDTDRAGVIYVAVEGEPPGAAPGDPSAATVQLTCLDPQEGRTLGQTALPASTSPDETFRTMIVLDDGGVLYALPGEDGETIQRYDCRGGS